MNIPRKREMYRTFKGYGAMWGLRIAEMDNYEHILFDQQHEDEVDGLIYAKRLAERCIEKERRHA